MATNVVASVISLCTAALKPGHPLHGTVQPPSKWADAAGFPGSKASPLRKFMARDSANGCGRQGRYAPQDAKGMLDLLHEAEGFAKAESDAKKDASRKRIQRQLNKGRAATAKGGQQAKTQAKATPKPRTPRKAKATA